MVISLLCCHVVIPLLCRHMDTSLLCRHVVTSPPGRHAVTAAMIMSAACLSNAHTHLSRLHSRDHHGRQMKTQPRARRTT